MEDWLVAGVMGGAVGLIVGLCGASSVFWLLAAYHLHPFVVYGGAILVGLALFMVTTVLIAKRVNE
ncbi:MAG: hypothetical protein L0332_16985 [Chloroflexi bacterium]|nr:hypothetical protein [Chloroflexota bacterium]MCI0581008.1 hypothetical protein [Chloroflexota bacterium]MCI0646347.1 hypothetical protein [Chloroflexota bacterium]MCI0728395.1 hypothetical protein [Chloroflexota bacterium]